MEGYVEGKAVQEGIVPLKEPRQEDQMGGAADGEEFGQALQDTQEKGLKGRGRQIHDLVVFSPRRHMGNERASHVPVSFRLDLFFRFFYDRGQGLKCQG